MAKDVLFKTMTFGGFNKEDVLEYIRAQQTQLTDALSEEYAKKIFALEDEVNALNEKLNSVEVGCERAKDVEGQIGALVLDALLYSDKIIRSAKASAKGISNQTRQTIEEAASGVDEIGEDISQMSDNFGVVVASLVSKINSLSSNLNSVADKLEVHLRRKRRGQTAEAYRRRFRRSDRAGDRDIR